MLYTTLCTHTLKRVAIALAAAMVLPVALATAADFGGYRPHYQGFGARSVGGRGGTVRKVTKLTDDGSSGTFRWAVTQPGPNIVVFETSGTIVLTGTLTIKEPYQTIAGQTAPSPGITIRDTYGIVINAHDHVWQHVRIRMGAHLGSEKINFRLQTGVFNFVLDHVSLSWSCMENFAAVTGVLPQPQDILITHSINSESLYNAVGCTPTVPSTGSGTASEGWIALASSPNGTLSFMNNLSAHNGGRNPMVGAGNRVLGVNNIAYNSGDGVGSSGPFMVVAAAQGNGAPHYGITAPWKVVWIGNIGIRGPSQSEAIEPTIRAQGAASGSQLYVSDNIGQGITGSSGNCTTGGQWNGVGVANINVTTGQPLTKAMICIGTLPSWYVAFNITARSTAGDNGLPGGRSAARDYVLANVGARPLDRDSVDARVVLDVKNGTGRIITREGDVGGFPVLAQNRRMLTVPANPNAVVDAVGRTVIEAWLETFARALEPASQLLSAPALVAPTDLRILQ